MSENTFFERYVAEAFDREGPGRPVSDAVHDDLLSQASRTRQWPHWLASTKEPPMRLSNSLAVGSPTVRVAAVLVATMLLALLVAGAGIAGSRLLAADDPIVVDPDGAGTATTISAALELAEEGDTILVRPGTYAEAVTIDKDVTVQGDGEPGEVVITPPEDGPEYEHPEVPFLVPYGILVLDASPTIRDLSVMGPSEDTFAFLVKGGAPTIENLDTDLSVEFHDGSTGTLRGSRVSTIDLTAPATVEGNTIIGIPADWGIRIWDGSEGFAFKDNVIEGKATAIGLGTHEYGTIEGNRLTDNRIAMRLSEYTSATVRDNRIEGGEVGIVIAGGDPLVEDNTVTGANGAGITIGGTATPTLSGNRSCDNGTDLEVLKLAKPEIDETNEICQGWPPEEDG